MSFAEKIGSLMQRPNDDLVSKDEVPWWLKYSARGLGTVAGGMGLFFGVFNMVTDTALLGGFSCVLADIWISLVAFTVLVFEAPCCCMFVDYVQEASNYMEKRPYWNRAVYYMTASAATLIFCFGVTLFLSCMLIFCTGLLYGTMALGKKGTRADMAAVASPTGSAPQGEHSRTLMEDPDVWRPAATPEEMRNNAASIYSSNNQQFPPAATSNSNLVEGAQPAGLSNPFDSRV